VRATDRELTDQRRTPPTMHAAVLTLLRALLRGLDKEIRRIMGDLLEHLLGVFATDDSEDRQATSQVCACVRACVCVASRLSALISVCCFCSQAAGPGGSVHSRRVFGGLGRGG
jgi:hypothetical protein